MATAVTRVTVRFRRSPASAEHVPNEVYTFDKCKGVAFAPETGLVTVIDSLNVPVAMFLMTPDVFILNEPSNVLIPELKTNGLVS